MNENILDSDFKSSLEEEEKVLGEGNKIRRRRALLPVWIKIFIWIFMIFGCLSPLYLIAGIFGLTFSFAMYGLESFDTFTVTGVVLTLLFLSKGVVAFGLWTEKKWAVTSAMMDAILGIVICILVIAVPLVINKGFTFRLELFVLVPYLIKMYEIKDQWERRKEYKK
ncbi:hypothetical protein V9L05_16780 [Bernardetia sp. Wsw4-3y2]|uniref:hypothetical protein n=1 Tax=unclassified Bernardetia TaxID=2647129 RepID=UPI0030D2E565